jgi:ribosome-binding protein aMBF1 (putative translation factor)
MKVLKNQQESNRAGPAAFDRLEEALKRARKDDPNVAAAYEAELLRFELAQLLSRLRTEQGLSQTALASKLGVPQSFVSRLENPASEKQPTLSTLAKVAAALGKRLVVDFVDEPKRRAVIR